jgi:hypothetical protein
MATTRELSAIQRAFADRFMADDRRIVSVRVIRTPDGPVINVVHTGDFDASRLHLPRSFEGLPVETQTGTPPLLAHTRD